MGSPSRCPVLSTIYCSKHHETVILWHSRVQDLKHKGWPRAKSRHWWGQYLLRMNWKDLLEENMPSTDGTDLFSSTCLVSRIDNGHMPWTAGSLLFDMLWTHGFTGPLNASLLLFLLLRPHHVILANWVCYQYIIIAITINVVHSEFSVSGIMNLQYY